MPENSEMHFRIGINVGDVIEEQDRNYGDGVNIAAKHEGGDPEAEQCLDHPSDILDYFMPKADVLKNGLIETFERNYIEKHVSLNKTADALIRAGIDVIVPRNAHS